jgi:hypothetical protein
MAKMPTTPQHLQVSFQPDADWLAQQMPNIAERWVQWIAS